MNKKPAVVAAIGAAVNAYLEAEESARLSALPFGFAQGGPASRFPLPAPNVWALFGRNQIMNSNALWQLRIFRK